MPNTKPANQAASQLYNLKVLLLDDEPHGYDGLVRILKERGCQVDLTETLADASANLLARRPDLVIAEPYREVVEEDSRRIETVKAFLAEAKKTGPVIIMTTLDRGCLLDYGIRETVHYTQYLQKPMTSGQMLPYIVLALERRVWQQDSEKPQGI